MRRTVAAIIVAGSMVAPAWAEEQKTPTVQPGPLSLYAAADRGTVADGIPPPTDHAVVRGVTLRTATRRPGALAGLYASLAALNVIDVYSTRRALDNGAREVNPVMANSGNFGAMLAVKAATTTSSIYLAERLWKKNRAAAIVTMVAVNGATAAIAARNFRNAR